MCQNASFFHFLDTPQFLSTTMCIICLIGLPIHVIGAICIIFKTPSQMNSMKWPMLNLHLWSASLDFSFGVLIVPFMYQPVLAGYSLGILNEFGVPMKDMFYLAVVQIGGVMVAVTILFETRFFILYARETFWKHLRRPWLVLNYLICLVYFVPTYLAVPDQKTGKEYQFGRYPCLPNEVYEDKVFLLTTWSTGVGYNSLLNTTPQQTLIFILLIYWNMKKSMSGLKMSKKTVDLHRRFMRSLVLQVTIPVVTVILPQIYNTIATYNSYYNQGLNNISICIMTTHGLVSSISMIYLHKSYWEAIHYSFCPQKFLVDDTAIFTKSIQMKHF
ncbi:hypothetical protein CRE_18728 [Caenorhabditis remanei]|uniref:Serpentine Receptor, class H n=2 Tax=Caenorhabditis remanei TaxID=31234 RepID=E3LJN9_CAERE|nr:hypothetical protein CRE_18728 [Caenorhabditis remanei]